MSPQRYSLRSLFHWFLLPSYLLFAYVALRPISFKPQNQLTTIPASAPPFSLTVYLPLSSRSIPDLDTLLEPFTSSPVPHVQQVVLFCPDHLLSQLRSRLAKLIEQGRGDSQTEFVLKSITPADDTRTELLKDASQASTDWVLILDEHGIDDISEPALLALRDDTVFVSTSPELYGFMSPLPHPNDTSRRAPFRYWQDPYTLKRPVLLPTSVLHARRSSDPQTRTSAVEQSIVFLFPSLHVLQSASKMVCEFRAREYSPRVLIYDRRQLFLSSASWQTLNIDLCNSQKKLVIYKTIVTQEHGPRTQMVLLDWLNQFLSDSKILFSAKEDKPIIEGLLSIHTTGATRIYIPEHQFPYTDWIGSLSTQELQHWYTPQFTFTITTYNRPHSLQRLLSSLSSALYFGDSSLDIRISIEKEANTETKHLAQSYEWPHGSIQIHQRIVHGGLMSAIVESWYPSNNNSYGLLLEDDVELSPLFYAWIKMTVLKYRYGTGSNISPNLFGISLYQQKTLELPLKGRQPFNARALFSSQDFPNIPVNTPYLSSVPCSWGAVYFPEHWREFHTYLSARLDKPKGVDENSVVPNVRSNKWTHSWKKFFIELVYLQGYVMLYPNYAEFVSLSTNHLEIGSHVHIRSAASLEKRKLFVLPLMQLPSAGEIIASSVPTGLLDLPGAQLPNLRDLPLLNLTGNVVTLDSLVRVGQERAKEIRLAVH